jgi:GT2 family glycosyltransferase
LPTDSISPEIDIAILIVGYRSRDTIGRCLDALQEQTVRPREVFVVENGSPDGERLSAADMPEWVNFIEVEINSGFAGANNQLARLATTRWVALLNPDAFPAPDWVEQLMAATRRYQDIEVFGSTQLLADTPEMLDGAGDSYHVLGLARRSGAGMPSSSVTDDADVLSACGAAMVVRRSRFEDLGGFDENYFCYFEDIDFCFRHRLMGGEVKQLRDAVVLHVGGASSGELSAFAVFHGVRNRMWTFFKDMPGLWMWLLLPLHLAVTAFQFLGSFKRGVVVPYARGYFSGLYGLPSLLSARRHIQKSRTVEFRDLWALMSKRLF